MFLASLGASLLGNALAGKGIVRAGSGNYKSKNNYKRWLLKQKRMRFLMLPQHLTILKYKSNIRISQDLMAFFQEIIWLKKERMGHTK